MHKIVYRYTKKGKLYIYDLDIACSGVLGIEDVRLIKDTLITPIGEIRVLNWRDLKEDFNA